MTKRKSLVIEVKIVKKKNYTTPNTKQDYLLSFNTKEEIPVIEEPKFIKETSIIEEPTLIEEPEIVEASQSIEEFQPYKGIVKTTYFKYLNIRTQPNLNCDVARTAQNNDILTIVREENGWGQLEDNNWVNLQYIEKI